MRATLVECVPNFSEGRDASKVDAIAAAITGAGGVKLLDREMDADHNRCVLTFVGPAEAAVEAAFRGVAQAVQLIDLNAHQGAHPRIGAADVVPFVPLEGVTLDDCVALARQLGERLWRELGLPVYLYEAAATRPERRNLENIRKGQYEGLRQEIVTNPDRLPDFGEARLHPTAGATVVGARKFLIAYNINLNTPEVNVAKQIARRVRASSGGLPCVKAMGVELKARNLAQVSMNLTDFETTSVWTAYQAVEKEAAALGAAIVDSEIVGLIPRRALEGVAAEAIRVHGFHPGMIVENKLAVDFSDHADRFIGAVAEATPAPGGGSVAAAAGALAAALGRMVATLSKGKKAFAQHAKQLAWAVDELEREGAALRAAVRRDAAGYDAVSAAYKLPKDSPDRAAAIQGALKGATSIPLEVAERAARVAALLEELEPITSPAMASDLAVGRLMADAAVGGALANVEINLESVTDPDFVTAVRARAEKLSG
jgi:glutamate formiminotransferase